MTQISTLLLLLTLLLSAPAMAQQAGEKKNNATFTFDDQLSIVYDSKGGELDSISAHLLADDLFKITGKKPDINTSLPPSGRNTIVIGEIDSDLIGRFIPQESAQRIEISGQWERFLFQVNETEGQNILVIAGSDPRGTAFGVFEISQRLGVSPWYWWADVPVEKQGEVVLNNLAYTSPSPSVKYRGIFINDEDWGLQPWSAKNFEPETGDIGPKTYAKIFELLLRLKANFIWPAMHPSTKAFFHYPGNVEVAKSYGITLGSSHAEPMLRNNVDEWDHDQYGDFNYITNKDQVFNYWESRVKDSKDVEAVYTIGMRGVHDSGMKGVKNKEEAAALLEQIIQDQRGMLENISGKDPSQTPQAFTAYKEVLDIYDAGLEVPEDVTIIWPDDNYGYIKRLNGPKETGRPGGSGVYYHESYWGRPHDYLWLSSTHPALVREEMMKAYQTGNREIWVLNVGDIKPHEYKIQLFMDMAYQAAPFEAPEHTKKHLHNWFKGIFGVKSQTISDVMWQYYNLAFERRPEFMGWSQTEPTTGIHQSDYSAFIGGDEINQRLQAYAALESQLKKAQKHLKNDLFPAFYQLAYYPVRGASLMNQKFLYRDKALDYHQEQRISAKRYKKRSQQAYEEIKKETDFFNQTLKDAKWNHIMDMAPRRLPVYQMPEIELAEQATPKENVGISPERPHPKSEGKMLQFNSWTRKSSFVDVFLKKTGEIKWQVSPPQDWIKVSSSQGTLSDTKGMAESRIWISIDWDKLSETAQTLDEKLTIKAGEQQFEIPVHIEIREPLKGDVRHVEDQGTVMMYAENYTQKQNRNGLSWNIIDGLGHSGASVQAFPLDRHRVDPHSAQVATLSYDFHLAQATENGQVTLTALPTHPITNQNSVRLGISVNGSPVQTVDFKTYGRSEEWKLNVLSNKASRTIKDISLSKGKNTIQVFWVDPGVVLDYIHVGSGKTGIPYRLKEETLYHQNHPKQ